MTLSEFKAWFEGFTEVMDGPPSHKQWERIQARVREISGAPVTYPVFVDRYLPVVRPNWQNVMLLNATACEGNTGKVAFSAPLTTAGNRESALPCGSNWMDFDSHSAMLALGKADAAELEAA